MDFAKLLKAARKNAGLTQAQAAKAWNVERRSLESWEIGRRAPSGPNLAKLLPFILPK